jgi:hypothetical protein
MPERRERGLFLTVMAVLFGVLALSNFTKAVQHLRSPEHLGVVVFGIRLTGFTSNLIFGWILGAVLAAYAYGLWTLKRWVLPLSMVYAFWVPLNLVLFWYRQTGPDIPPLGSILGYLAVAFTGSIGTALYLAYHRDTVA